MRRRVVRLCALILAAMVLTALLPVLAHADSPKITRVYDLKVLVRNETFTPDGILLKPSVTLTWWVDAESGPAFGDREITIRRSHHRDTVDRAPIFKVLPGPSAEVKGHVMVWTDEHVRPGETYFYRVESGRLNPLRFDVVKATVGGAPGETEKPQSLDERRQEYAKNVSWPERLAASLIIAAPNWLVNVLGLQDPVSLVFMIDTQAPLVGGMPQQRDLPYWHVFTESEMGAVATLYDSLAEFAPIWLVVAVVLLALGILYNMANPQSKAGFREYVLGFLLAMVMLKFGPQLLGFVFDVNYALVMQFKHIALPLFHQPLFFQPGETPMFLGLVTLADENISFGDAIIAFIAVFCIGVLNFQYIMRKINIALLVGLIPLIAVISIAPAKRYVLGIWFRELIANIFLQAAHAAVLAFLLLIIHATEQNPSTNAGVSETFWVKLVALLALAGLAGLVRSVIGAETVTGPPGAAMAMFGVAGLLALGKMIKPAAAGVAGAAGGAAVGGMAGAAGGAAGAAGAAGMAAAGLRGLGRAGLTASGAMAGGLVMGAALENPGAGIAMGAALGSQGGERLLGSSAPGQETPAQRASRDVFGQNVFDRSGSARLQEQSLALARPGYGAIAAEARSYVSGAQQSLVGAKANLDAHKPVYDEARARLTEIKAMYGPKAAHLENVREQFADIEPRFQAAQQQYLEILNTPEESRGPSYNQDFEAAKAEYDQVRAERADLEAKLDAAPQAYQDALADYQAVEAEHARRQQDVARAEQKLTHDALVEEFQKIKDRQSYRTPGGVNGPQWGP